MVAFPSWLEDRLIIDGLSITEESNRISSLGDVGEPIERLQSTRSGAKYTARFRVSRNEMQLFRDWWQIDAKYGLAPVEWKDPFSLETLSFLVTEPPVYTPAGAGINIDLELYLFPGYSPPEIVDVTGSLVANLPGFSMDGAGSIWLWAYGGGSLDLPAFGIGAAGMVIADVEGEAALELPLFELQGREGDYTGGRGYLDLPAFEIEGEGEEHITAEGMLEVPVFELTAAGTNSAPVLTVYLQDIIADLGLTSNQVFCLDAADGDSYGGSGQTWSDRSAAGNNFTLGSGTGSDSADPTFVGTPDGGTAAEYFTFDGGDYFTAAGTPTFDDTWGTDNSTFTVLGMIYLPSAGGATKLYLPISNQFNLIFNLGVSLRIQQIVSGTLETRLDLIVYTGFTSSVVGTVTTSLIQDQWVFFAMSFSEGGGATASVSRLQNVVQTFDGTLATHLTVGSTPVPKIGAQGGGSTPFPAGTRLGCIAAWSTALTASNIADIYTALKERYTSLP